MAINHANFAETTLGAAITTTDGTSITVSSSAGFPNVDFIIAIDTEVMLVTNVSGTTWTVTRGYESSTAATHANGASVYHNISAGEADSIATKAPLASPTFTGTPTAPTAAAATDTTQVATTAFVHDVTDTLVANPMTAALNAGNYDLNHVKMLLLNSLIDDGNSGTSKTIDWNLGIAHKATLTDNVTFAFTGDSAWVQRDSTRVWKSIASSSDGVKLVACINGGYIYTSTDSGATWTQRDSSRSWYSVASSSDGTKLVACANNGYLYTSTDSGQNWTQRESSRAWYAVASSSDGVKLVAVVMGGYIYTSTDSGVTWTERASSQYWQFVVSSSDGTKLAATVWHDYLYTSDDSGATWTKRSASYYNGLACSADGSKLVAFTDWSPYYLFTSTDSGESWTQRGPQKSWRSVASSSDGTKLIAVAYGDSVYLSSDSGESWTAKDTSRNWLSAASSSDGNKLVAGVNDGYIYTCDLSTAVVVPSAPCLLALKLIQDGTGGRTVTWPATVKGTPTINPSPNGETYVLFFFDGTNFNAINPSTLTETKLATGFTIAGGTTSKTLTVDADVTVSALAPKASPAFTGSPTFPTGTPASADAAGTTGQILWDGSYLYVCTASNTWKRAAIATW